jgi:hypothetical protein
MDFQIERDGKTLNVGVRVGEQPGKADH